MARTLPALLLAISATAQTRGDALYKEAEDALNKGNYTLALDKAAEAARASEQASDPRGLGRALNLEGLARQYRGEYPAAIGPFEKSLALARQTGDGNGEVTRLNNLANVYFFLGRYSQALRHYESAARRLEASKSENWYAKRAQMTFTNLAVLYEQLGQNQRALDYYREIRSLPRALRADEQAQVLTNLGVVYRRLGDAHKALDSYREADALLRTFPNAAAELYLLHNTGVVQSLDLADPPGALATFRRALAIAERSSNKRQIALEHLYLGETLFRTQRFDPAAAEFTAALEAARAAGLVDERWTAEYGLGRVHLARGDRAAALASFRQAISTIESVRSNLGSLSLKAEFLANKRDVYDAAIAILLDEPSPPAREVFELIEQGRARNLRDVLAGEGAPATLAAVQSRLDPDTLLADYWLAAGRIAAVWITHDAAGVISRRVSPAESNAIADFTRAAADERNSSWRTLARSVGALVLQALPLSASVKRMIAVPDGALHLVPLEALEWNGALFLDQRTVWYAPSASALANRREFAAPRYRWPWSLRLAAFADPLAPAGADAAAREDRGRLRAAEGEARAVAGELPGSARIYAGAENRKRLFLAPATLRTPVIHIATHAAVDTSDARRSHLLFTPDPAEPGSEYLYWREISGIELPATELVTLAACDTERGQVIRGEGAQSFSRAFLSAGATATVTTLWRVPDAPTAALMQRFYRHLAAGDAKAEALRKAKIDFARSAERAHPFYWAAFVLNGDGVRPLAPVVSWWWFAAAGAGLAAALLTVLRR
ncbi:MAG: CHAT domain-containing protein [Bryobacteraceae bacterium]